MNKIILVPNCRGWIIDDLMKTIKGDRDYIDIKYPEEQFRYEMGDIIHIGSWGSANANIPTPTVLTVHHICKEAEKEVVNRIKLLNPFRVISICNKTKEVLRKYKIESVVIPNPTKKREFRVGYLGLNDDNKNLDMIDKAIEEVGAVNCGIKRERVEKPLTDKQLERWYRSLNVYVVASRAEGGPMPAIEAMACGVPVISTEVGMLADRNDVTYFDGSLRELKERLRQFMFEPQITEEEFINKHLKIYEQAYQSYNRNRY